jgi:hypothetical protein
MRTRRAAGFIALVLASSAGAQRTQNGAWVYGFAVGSPAAGLPVHGAVVGIGRATWRANKRLAFRSELTASHLPSFRSEELTSPCPAESRCTSPPRRPTGVAGISEQLIVNDDYITRGESRGAYYVLGGGMYRQVSPSAVGSIGGALEGGIGFKFGAASFEAKAVYIRHWTGGDSGLIPVTFGFAW